MVCAMEGCEMCAWAVCLVPLLLACLLFRHLVIEMHLYSEVPGFVLCSVTVCCFCQNQRPRQE